MAGTEPIEERFKKAVWIIRNGPPIPTDNNTKLNFYSYFKQVSFVRSLLLTKFLPCGRWGNEADLKGKLLLLAGP